MRCPRIGISSVAAVLLAACSDVPQAPDGFTLRLASADVWSGGELAVITPRIGTGTPAFELFLDDLALTARRTDDTTIVVSLPDLPGEHRMTALATGSTMLVQPDVVRLHGFRESFDGPPLKGNLHAWPEGGRATILGVSGVGPALLDVSSGALRQWPDSIHGAACNFGGVGPTWSSDDFVFQAHRPGGPSWDCLPYRAWRLLPTPVPTPGSLPTPAVSFQAWSSAEVAPGRWLFTTDDHLWGFDCRSGACVEDPDLYWTGGGTRLVLSPRGDRVLVVQDARVLDPETLTILYRPEGYVRVWDAAFAPAGDTLFLVGTSGFGPDDRERMQAIRPDDGALLADIPLEGPDGTLLTPTSVALDPVAPWIYVAGEVALDSLRLPALLVLDRASLRPVALLRTAEREAWTPRAAHPYDRLKIVPAPLEGAIYVVWEILMYDPPVSPTRVYRFGRVP